jgi:hypothetical protein
MKYLLFILLFIFTTSLDRYLFNSGVIPLEPSKFFIPLFLIISVLSYKYELYLSVFKTHTFKFFLIFFFLSIFFSTISEASFEVVITDIVNKIITLMLFTMAMCFFHKYDIKLTKTLFFISIVVLGLSIWYDTFFGLEFTKIGLRKGGFATSPNAASSAIKLLGFCLIINIKNSKSRLLLLLFIASTIFITFSRSGFLSLLIIIIFLVINQWSPKFNVNAWKLISSSFKIIAIGLVSYFILLNIADILQKQIPEFSEGSAGKRIDLLLGRSNPNDIMFLDQGESGRETVALKFIDLFKDNPFGYGTGYTSDIEINSTNTHNYYLTAAIDFSIIGLLVLIWFLFSGFKFAIKFNYYYYFIFFILLFFECFVSHDLFTHRAIIISLAFMDYNLNLIKNETI